MPELHEVYLEFKNQGFEVVSLVYNGRDDERGVQRYIDRLGLTWPVVIGDDLEGPQLPYIVLNRDGSVFAFHDRNEESFRELIVEALSDERNR